MQGFCDTIRVELKPCGVHVLVALPGPIVTGYARQHVGSKNVEHGVDRQDRKHSVIIQPLTSKQVAHAILDKMALRRREWAVPTVLIGRIASVLFPSIRDRLVWYGVKTLRANDKSDAGSSTLKTN